MIRLPDNDDDLDGDNFDGNDAEIEALRERIGDLRYALAKKQGTSREAVERDRARAAELEAKAEVKRLRRIVRGYSRLHDKLSHMIEETGSFNHDMPLNTITKAEYQAVVNMLTKLVGLNPRK